VVHVAPSQGSCVDQVEDRRVDATDCVEPFYPKIAVSMY
jgi:hypothetical protein